MILELPLSDQHFNFDAQKIPTQHIVLKDTQTNKFMKFELPAYVIDVQSIKSEDSKNVLISPVFYKELGLNWCQYFYVIIDCCGYCRIASCN